MSVRIITGDCREMLKTLADESINCVITSPPYFGLRDYGVAGQIGLEPTPDAFVAEMVSVFAEVRRVLRRDGTVWLNLGDSYSTQASGKVADPMAKSTLAGVKTQEVANRSSRASGRYLKCPSLPQKNLIGIPWRVAFALQADGWYLRQDIIWAKPNPMPESIKDRCTKAHEYIFMLTKSAKYYYDADAIKEPSTRAEWEYETPTTPGNKDRKDGGCTQRKPKKQDGHGRRHAGFNARWDEAEARGGCSTTRNKRSIWEVATSPFAGAHFATFPPALIEPCILAGCPLGGTVLDPFGGAGTTGLVADRLGRNAILIELNPDYVAMADGRICADAGFFADVEITQKQHANSENEADSTDATLSLGRGVPPST